MQNNDEREEFRLPRELKRRLEDYSKSIKLTKGMIIRACIECMLKNKDCIVRNKYKVLAD
jgi:predicted DNA-binding protein